MAKLKSSSINHGRILVETLRSRLSCYGISCSDLDANFDHYEDWVAVARTGLAIVDSIATPADASYVLSVTLPSFLKRECPVFWSQHLTTEGDFMAGLRNYLINHSPQFYDNCISWPASTL